ncbi:MAG: hypothetical protein JWL82_195 [Parcubacteria group bacterium]|nr:hypothetical protein [Parcubacteria group bacterium]
MIRLKRLGEIILLAFTLIYVTAGTLYLVHIGNTEFLAYVVVLVAILGFAAWCYLRFGIPLWMLWLLSILGALHLAGGGLLVHGAKLYDYVLIPIPNWTGLTIWKFDQLVHPLGAIFAALITYALLARSTPLSRIMLAVIAFMVANGCGALNEVIEFITKITLPDTGVGGYYNTALDLFFNMIGAALGAIGAAIVWKKHPPK